ncbi:MscL family protein [Leptospirillum ferrooxidans]|jgi:hypothetical protein|uniref:MscL family protein n=1 Tax=Leptospirillum ferrooxidans TaxID=180 RepID=UPI00031A4FBA|nr:MscL family protein [Leptospirillum ferrooxidans]
MLRGFTKFMMRRNMMVMAVGIIIGATFGKIVCLLLSDMIMPPIGLLTGKADFSNLFVDLRQGKPPPTLPHPHGSAKVRGSNVRLRPFHQYNHRLRDHRLLGLHSDPVGQPADHPGAPKERGAGSSHQQGLAIFSPRHYLGAT